MNGGQKKLVETVSNVQQGRVALEEGQAREGLQGGESGISTAHKGGRGGGGGKEGEGSGGGGRLGGGKEGAATADASVWCGEVGE